MYTIYHYGNEQETGTDNYVILYLSATHYILSMSISSKQLKVAIQTTRPSFLVLTPVCIFLGLSTSLSSQAPINVFMFFLVLTGALAAHISVNTLNEYYDF